MFSRVRKKRHKNQFFNVIYENTPKGDDVLKNLFISCFLLCFVLVAQALERPLDSVQSFLYQLQEADLVTIGLTDFDLVVLDYSSDGSDQGAYTASAIQALKASPGGPKIVLAYMSIGEAEDYRFYWQDDWAPENPVWLHEENPDWPGNYKVRYWEPGWQTLIFQYLDKILDAGFDGVYLDIIDAYETYMHLSSVQSPNEMADFVKAIRDRARQRNPNFLVFPQNGAELAELVPSYLAHVDGIGQEDCYYGYDSDGEKTPSNVTSEIESWLDVFRNADKIVLTIDYPFTDSEDEPHFEAETAAKIRDIYQKSRTKGYIPYCSVRNLNFLTHNPGHEYKYIVDGNHPDASDQNPGTIELPWATLQFAARNVFAGDTVLIREALYSQYFQTMRDGDSNPGRIVFKAYPGENPVLDGAAVSASGTAIRIEHDYIHIAGLEIRNWETGIWIDNAGHTQIDDCEIHEVWYGVGAANGSHDFEMNRLNLHDFTLYGFDASPSGGERCHSGVLNDCIAHTGRDPEQNVDGFALGHGSQLNFVFNRCQTWGVYDGFDISARNVTLNGCLAFDCGWGGFKVWQDSVILVNCIAYNNAVTNVEIDWDEEPGFSVLKNCTLYNGGSWNVYVENPGDYLIINNSILAGGDNIGLAVDPNSYRGDHNLFHTNNPPRMIVTPDKEYSLEDIAAGQWFADTGQDQHSIVVYSDSQVFTDPRAADFHLIAGSPAIDAGKSSFAPDLDFEGLSRFSDSAPDIGAFEFTGTASGIHENSSQSHPVSGFRLFQNYPNPFNPSTHIRFAIPEAGQVIIRLFDVQGRLVQVLTEDRYPAGSHEILLNMPDLPTGLYIYELTTGEYQDMRKLIFTK